MTRSKRLVVVLALNLVLVAALAVIGVAAHSLGVLAEGVDYLADSAGIGLALLAIWLSQRPGTARRPAGFPRAPAWAALVNASWLLLLTVLVTIAALNRLVTGVHIVHGLPVLVVSAVAAAVMLAGAAILGGDADTAGSSTGGGLNVRAVLIDTLADAATAAGVAVAGAVIAITGGLYWLDPAIAIVVAALVGYHAIRLLIEIVATLRHPARPVHEPHKP